MVRYFSIVWIAIFSVSAYAGQLWQKHATQAVCYLEVKGDNSSCSLKNIVNKVCKNEPDNLADYLDRHSNALHENSLRVCINRYTLTDIGIMYKDVQVGSYSLHEIFKEALISNRMRTIFSKMLKEDYIPLLQAFLKDKESRNSTISKLTSLTEQEQKTYEVLNDWHKKVANTNLSCLDSQELQNNIQQRLDSIEEQINTISLHNKLINSNKQEDGFLVHYKKLASIFSYKHFEAAATLFFAHKNCGY